jgi:hypothetical protein
MMTKRLLEDCGRNFSVHSDAMAPLNYELEPELTTLALDGLL